MKVLVKARKESRDFPSTAMRTAAMAPQSHSSLMCTKGSHIMAFDTKNPIWSGKDGYQDTEEQRWNEGTDQGGQEQEVSETT